MQFLENDGEGCETAALPSNRVSQNRTERSLQCLMRLCSLARLHKVGRLLPAIPESSNINEASPIITYVSFSVKYSRTT